jgi:hypothetical protein
LLKAGLASKAYVAAEAVRDTDGTADGGPRQLVESLVDFIVEIEVDVAEEPRQPRATHVAAQQVPDPAILHGLVAHAGPCKIWEGDVEPDRAPPGRALDRRRHEGVSQPALKWQATNGQQRGARTRLGHGAHERFCERWIRRGVGRDQHVLPRPHRHVVAHHDGSGRRDVRGGHDATLAHASPLNSWSTYAFK